jgi:uncharacterized protein YidB (DUF937 family)
MGLLDQLSGQLMGKLGAQQQDSVPQSALLSSVMGLIGGSGALSSTLQKLKDSGLEEQVTSWIGSGENQPVSGDQIKDALGEETVQQIAQQSGIAPEHAATGLAQLLPQIINELTPNGQVPHEDLLQEGLSLLKGKLFG